MSLESIAPEAARPEGGDLGVLEPIAPPAKKRAVCFVPHPLIDPLREATINTLPNTPLALLERYLTPEVVNSLVDNTRRRREDQSRPLAVKKKHARDRDPQAPHSRYHGWPGSHQPPNASEVMVYVASIIYMGLHQENRLKDYWRTDGLRPSHPIRHYISRDRWQAINASFATFDPDDDGSTSQPRCFERVEALSEHIQTVSRDLINLGTKVTVDEAMVRFTGRSKEATTVKGKPTPRGFRVWVCGHQGYFVSWLWHRNNFGPVGIPYPNGRGLARNAPEAERQLAKLNNTQQAVVTLLKKLPRAQYHVYLDNLFSSAALFTYLRTYLDCAATGTARLSSGIDEAFVELKKDDRRKDHVQWNALEKAPYPGGLVNQFAWKDNALALFFSTYYTGDEAYVWRPHRRPKTNQSEAFWGSDQYKNAPLPAFADDYNLLKGGVDRGDQLRSYNEWKHHIRSSRHSALFLEFLIDVILVNTYLLQKRFRGQLPWPCFHSQSEWRQALFEAIIVKYGTDAAARQRGSGGPSKPGVANSPDPHTLIFRGKKSRCVACQGKTLRAQLPPKRRVLGEVSANAAPKPSKQTRYGCDLCEVAICNSDICWYKFHGRQPSEAEVPRDAKARKNR